MNSNLNPNLNKVYSTEEIKDMLFPIFSNNAVYNAVLFGSYAKGTATVQSDIDIVIDSRGELLNIGFYGLLEEITQKLGKQIDLLEVSEFQKNGPIYENVQKEGVILYAR